MQYDVGRFVASGYRYNIPWWEVLNEVDAEHSTSPEDYALRFDVITEAIAEVAPATKFVGIAMAGHNHFDYYRYFLNHSHHTDEGAKHLDAISFHFYASPSGPEDT